MCEKWSVSYKKYWRAPNIMGADFLTARLSNGEFDNHLHQGFTISMVEEGELPLLLYAGTLILKPGDLVLFGPNVPQGLNLRSAKRECSYRSLILGEKYLSHTSLAYLSEYKSCVFILHSTNNYHEALHLHKTAEENTAYDIQTVVALFVDYFRASPSAIRSALPPSAIIREILDYVENHCSPPPSINKLSEMAGLCSAHLMRRFKSEIGITLHSYINQKRIDRAKELIVNGASLLSAAYDLGFSDQSHFTKTFLRFTGVSPQRYAVGEKYFIA